MRDDDALYLCPEMSDTPVMRFLCYDVWPYFRKASRSDAAVAVVQRVLVFGILILCAITHVLLPIFVSRAVLLIVSVL